MAIGWLSQFLLGRPGTEYVFDFNPKLMDFKMANREVLQENLAGDLKQSILKVRIPTIKLNSDYLTFSQRNQFESLVGVSDTFLSFITRDAVTPWSITDELVTVLTTTTLQLPNSSATRLSAALVALGAPSIIGIQTPFNLFLGNPFGGGGFGGGPFGGLKPLDPGTITYDDSTRIITMSNALPDTSQTVYLTYTYTGWLVKLQSFDHKIQGGWLDRFQYDFILRGA